MLPIPIILSMSLITSLLPELYCAITPALQAVFEPSDGDAWTENDNATYPWTVHVTYTGTLSFTTARKKVGSYSLKANHTGVSTNFMFKVDLDSNIDVSSYWALSFWIRIENKTGYLKFNVILANTSFPSGNTGNMYSYQLWVEDSTWWKVVIPLDIMTKGGTVSFTSIRYIQFYGSSFGASDYATIYIDELHFMDDSTGPTITNPLDDAALANLYSAFLDAELLNLVYNGTSYTGLSDWMNKDTGAQADGNLDAESLGQSAFILSYLYDLTGWSFYRDKAEEYAVWLLEFQNETYGYVHYQFNNATKAFSNTTSPAVSGWALAGLSYVYGVTSNTTYKDGADLLRYWFCDIMWNGTDSSDAGWFSEWNFTGGYGYGSIVCAGMDGGGAIAGLGTYYAKVTQNSTVKSHMDLAYSKAYCLYACRCSGSGGRCSIYRGTTETTAYCFWGFYMMSQVNSTYWDQTVRYSAQYMIATHYLFNNASYPNQFGTQFTTKNSFYKMHPWALTCNLELAYLSRSYDASALLHVAEVLRDGLVAFKGDYWYIPFDNLDSTTRSWTPTALFFYTTLLHYYLDKVNQPFAVSTDANLISSTFSNERLTLTINGTSSTTRVYCGDKGEPKAVYAVNGTATWSYDASTAILTLDVTHECQTKTLIYWKFPGDMNDDRIVDISDIGYISAHWYPGPPIGPLGYDANYDLNLDGAIDIYEIGIISDHWGETW